MRVARGFTLLVFACAIFSGRDVFAAPVLLVGAANGTSVERFDATTGQFIDFFTSGGPVVNGPSALAIGPNGNLFMKGWSTATTVIQYDGVTGVFVNVFASPTGGAGSAILFGPDGNLYAEGPNREINRFDGTTGALLGTFVATGSGGLTGIGGMRFGPDGNLYVRNTNIPSNVFNVLRYDGTTGAFIDAFVASGSGGLGANGDILFGPDGNLYVADNENGVVRRYNGSTGAFIDDFASGGGLEAPYGLAFGPDGSLYVASDKAGTGDAVLRFNGTTGAFIDMFAPVANANPTYLVFTEAVIPAPTITPSPAPTATPRVEPPVERCPAGQIRVRLEEKTCPANAKRPATIVRRACCQGKDAHGKPRVHCKHFPHCPGSISETSERNPCLENAAACPLSPGSAALQHTTVEAHQSGQFPAIPPEVDEELNEDLPARVDIGPLRGPLAPTVDGSEIGSTPGPTTRSSRPPGAAQVAGTTPVIFFTNTSLRSTVTPYFQAPDMSGADNGETVLVSSNSSPSGARSTNGGSTFAGLDPTTIFPSGPAMDNAGNLLDGGIDGDQIVIYVPQIDRFIWLMQFFGANGAAPSNCGKGPSKLRLAAASSADVAAGGTAWTYWDLPSGLFGSTTWFDYPDLSYGDNSLFLSINDVCQGRRVMRMSLAQIAGAGTIGIDYTNPVDGGRAFFGHLAQNVTDTAYWAGHDSNSRLRIFSMRDGEGVYSWRSVDVNSWCNGDRSSITPGGTNDWLAFPAPGNAVLGSARRIDVTNDQPEIWFAWTAGHKLSDGNGCGFDQTHVEIVTVRESDFSVLSQMQVWNPTIAFAYPALASDPNGEVGMTLGFGGGGNEQNTAVGFWGDFVVYPMATSTNSVARFGDYVTIRRSPVDVECSPLVFGCTQFSAEGYGINASGVDPHYVVFGRLSCGDSGPVCDGDCSSGSGGCLKGNDDSCFCGIP